MKKRILLVVVAFAAVMASALTACGPSAAEKKQREEAERVRVQDSIAKARAEVERVAAAQAKALEDSLKQEAKKFVTRFYDNIAPENCAPVIQMLTSDFIKVIERAKVVNGQKRADTDAYALGGLGEWQDGHNRLHDIKCKKKVGEVELANADSATVACFWQLTYQWIDFGTSGQPDGFYEEKYKFNDKVKIVRKDGMWKITDVIRNGKSLRKLWTKKPELLYVNPQYI